MTRRRRSALTAFLLLGLFAAPLSAAQFSVELPAWGTEPSPAGTGDGVLNAISVRSATDIWAVGQREVLWHRYALTIHYDGSAWTVVPSPTTDGLHLEDVVSIGPADVWAVGWLGNPSSLDSQNVAMHWDGTAWTIVPTPQPGFESVDQLRAVDAAAPNDVWATGMYWDAQNRSRSLIMRWNGTSWRIVRTGSSVTGRNDQIECDTYDGLTGITVISATDVWAVGDATTCHYDGRFWTEIPSIQPQGTEFSLPLEDVSAASPSDVWAVGARVTYYYYTDWDAFAEHWDGAHWSRPISLPGGVVLLGVDAVASNDVWAVGRDDYGAMIIHYDGTSWSSVPTPDANRAGRLAGVGSAAANDLWAVGSYQDGALIEHAPSSTQGALFGRTNVSFSTVSWFGPENGSIETNLFGEYQVGGLTAGTYTVTATEPGCGPDSRTITIVAGVTQELNLHINCSRSKPGS